MRPISIIILTCLITTACEEKPVQQSTGKLPQFYKELILASIDSAKLDTNFLKSTLDSMQLGKSEFDVVLKQAHENPEVWIAALDSILKKLKGEQGQEIKKRALFQNKTPVSLPTKD